MKWNSIKTSAGKAINTEMFSKKLQNDFKGICNTCGHDNSLVLSKKCEHWVPYEDE